MNEGSLRDVLVFARQESARMQQYYLGAEHLCVGLLHVPQSALAAALEAQGITPARLIDHLRRKAGKGARQRLWAGMPHSPRADVVIGLANDLALEAGRAEPSQHDLALALLDESDNLPVRILTALGVDLEQLRTSLEARLSPIGDALTTEIVLADSLEGDLPLPCLHLLRRMFRRNSKVRLERRLPGGHTSAIVLLVTPFGPEGDAEAAVVAKLDRADAILDEAQRYDTLVRHTLPPLTSRLIDAPVVRAEDDLAGLMYTFIPGDTARVAALDLTSDALGTWLRDEFYPTFSPTWWAQRRPYRFAAWAEYDWLLPPLLTIEQIADDAAEIALVVRDPVRRARLRALDYGTVVAVEDFVLEQIRPERGTLLLIGGKGQEAARRAFRIEVRQADLKERAYYRGEIVERVAGRVWRTRDEILMHSLLALDPDFDPRAATIPGTLPDHRLPNPVIAYDALLDVKLNGTLSTLHGDMHLGNLLVGQRQAPFLIDFEDARTGHTLFDWACLEVSLLSAVVAPAFGNDWDAARRALGLLTNLKPPLTAEPAHEVLYPLLAVRDIAGKLLAEPGNWSEYMLALAFTSLRTLGFADLPPGARRLLLLVSAQAMADVRAAQAFPATDPSDATQMDKSTT